MMQTQQTQQNEIVKALPPLSAVRRASDRERRISAAAALMLHRAANNRLAALLRDQDRRGIR